MHRKELNLFNKKDVGQKYLGSPIKIYFVGESRPSCNKIAKYQVNKFLISPLLNWKISITQSAIIRNLSFVRVWNILSETFAFTQPGNAEYQNKKENLYFSGTVMPQDIHRTKIAHLCWVYGMNASSKITELDYPFSVKSILQDQLCTWLLLREECSPPQRYLRGPNWTPSHLLRVTTGPCNPNLQVVIRPCVTCMKPAFVCMECTESNLIMAISTFYHL